MFRVCLSVGMNLDNTLFCNITSNYMKFIIEVNENNGMKWPRLMGELGKRMENWNCLVMVRYRIGRQTTCLVGVVK